MSKASNAVRFGHKCPKCGADMVPMASNKGFRCAVPGNTWRNGRWSICDGAVWNKGNSRWVNKPQAVRAESWPVIATPTDEQTDIRDYLSMTPDERGGRCLIIDAGPGTAKTTTISWSMEGVYTRRGTLECFGLRTFNRNAADVLLTKLPVECGDVNTLNSGFAQAQGFKFSQYDKGKALRLYKGMVSHLDEKDRPSFGKLGKVLERSRDICLWADAGDVGAWTEIIATVMERFPSLAKKCQGQEKHILTYLPTLATLCLSEKSKIDIQEQVTRPVTEAMARTGWRMPCRLTTKKAAEWSDEDVSHFCALIRSIQLPNVAGLVIDEAQDLSLCQIAVVLAQTFRTGGLVIIGGDANGTPGQAGYKAGQAIYGWRGAFGGCLNLIARLWECLTGETAERKALTVTFRHGEEICAAYRPLNTVIESARPAGQSAAFTVSGATAFETWLTLPEGQTALWITRTNAAIFPVFLDTLRECADCTIRGNGDFASSVDAALYEAAGVADGNGDFKVSLDDCLTELRRIIEEQSDGGEVDPNSMEAFMLGIGEALQREPALLDKAQLTDRALTVGNLRRFVVFFADKKSRRVLTTVYRCKGDEADLAVMADTTKFNESWGDSMEDAACRHVAASRAKKLALYVGHVIGVIAPKCTDPEEAMETLL